MPAHTPISFGMVDGHPVFMDEASDSYFRLAPEQEQAFIALIESGRIAGQTLSAPDAARFGFDRIPVHAEQQLPTLSLADDIVLPRSKLSDVARVWHLLVRTRRDLAAGPIAKVLADLCTGNLGRPARSDGIRPAALRFLAARRLLAAAPQCLTDSVSLVRWLGPFPGLTLVFGVKLDPFEAHCWVVEGDWLLNDRLDHIAPFHAVRVLACSTATL